MHVSDFCLVVLLHTCIYRVFLHSPPTSVQQYNVLSHYPSRFVCDDLACSGGSASGFLLDRSGPLLQSSTIERDPIRSTMSLLLTVIISLADSSGGCFEIGTILIHR